jgi:hypothetical protein
MARGLGRRREDAGPVLDPPRAQPQGEGGGGRLPPRGRVAPARALGGALPFGDPPARASVLRLELGHRFGGGVGREPLPPLAGARRDRLAAPSGLFGWPGEGAVLTGDDRGGVADPGAER